MIKGFNDDELKDFNHIVTENEYYSTPSLQVDYSFYLSQMARWLETIKDLKKDNERLTNHVNDLQSGMYINCVYCGHRYGPNSNTPVAMADVLKEHIEQCTQHPLYQLKQENALLRNIGDKIIESLSNKNKDGKTIVDFIDVWLTQARNSEALAISNLEKVRNELRQAEGIIKRIEDIIPEWKSYRDLVEAVDMLKYKAESIKHK